MVYYNQQERCSVERVRRAKHNEQIEILKKLVIHRLPDKKPDKKHSQNEILWATVEHVAYLRRILEGSEDGESSEVSKSPLESSSIIERQLKSSEVPQDHRLPSSAGMDSESENPICAAQTVDNFNLNFPASYGQGFCTEQYGYYECDAQQYQLQYYSNQQQQQMCSNVDYYHVLYPI